MSTLLIETPRLRLRALADTDAPFIVALLNDPDWLRYIGDRGVRSLEDAHAYLQAGPMRSYADYGFGLWAVVEAVTGDAVGMCGLIKRDALDHLDLGFAFLPRGRGHGYAREAAQATLDYAIDDLALDRVLAITDPDNGASIRLLESLGFHFETMIELHPEQPSRLFALTADARR